MYSNKSRTLFLSFALAGLFIFFSVWLQAQTNNVQLLGKITDSKTQIPLQGATVLIKGTTHQVLTEL